MHHESAIITVVERCGRRESAAPRRGERRLPSDTRSLQCPPSANCLPLKKRRGEVCSSRYSVPRRSGGTFIRQTHWLEFHRGARVGRLARKFRKLSSGQRPDGFSSWFQGCPRPAPCRTMRALYGYPSHTPPPAAPWPTPFVRSPWMPCRPRIRDIPARPWAWPTSPRCCGATCSSTTPATRNGGTATASCSRTATARCCCIRCCI